MRHRVIDRLGHFPPAQRSAPNLQRRILHRKLLLQVVVHIGMHIHPRQRAVAVHAAGTGNGGVRHGLPAFHFRFARQLLVLRNALEQHAFRQIGLCLHIALGKAQNRIALFAHLRTFFPCVVAPHQHLTGMFALVAEVLPQLVALGFIIGLLAARYRFKNPAPLQVLAAQRITQAAAHRLVKFTVQLGQIVAAKQLRALAVQPRQVSILEAFQALTAQHA